MTGYDSQWGDMPLVVATCLPHYAVLVPGNYITGTPPHPRCICGAPVHTDEHRSGSHGHS